MSIIGLAGRALRRLGMQSIGLGNKGGNELKGFLPYPVIQIGKLDHEWDAGLSWYMKNVEGYRVLDTGFVSHVEFTKMLCSLGFEVWGVDTKNFDDVIPNLKHVQELVWKTGLAESFFDTIISNSLIEHLGLKCYGQPELGGADSITMSEFHRLLKPGGLLLMQVPFGASPKIILDKGQDFYRVYTRDMFRDLVTTFVVEQKYYVTRAKDRWIEVSEDIATKVEQGGGLPSCLLYAKLRKRHE